MIKSRSRFEAIYHVPIVAHVTRPQQPGSQETIESRRRSGQLFGPVLELDLPAGLDPPSDQHAVTGPPISTMSAASLISSREFCGPVPLFQGVADM